MESGLLVARRVTVIRDGVRIVDGASLVLHEAETASIAGASGSGKSTFLRAVATLVPTAEGEVRLEGRRVSEIGITEYRRRVSYVPQLPRMFPGTVGDNIRAGPRFHGDELNTAKVGQLLERVGLRADLEARAAVDLSGGERLRVALARSLANEPRVLLLDEPTAALDPIAARVILDLFVDFGKRGMALVLVTHSDEHAAYVGGKRYSMNHGHLTDEGAV